MFLFCTGGMPKRSTARERGERAPSGSGLVTAEGPPLAPILDESDGAPALAPVPAVDEPASEGKGAAVIVGEDAAMVRAPKTRVFENFMLSS